MVSFLGQHPGGGERHNVRHRGAEFEPEFVQTLAARTWRVDVGGCCEVERCVWGGAKYCRPVAGRGHFEVVEYKLRDLQDKLVDDAEPSPGRVADWSEAALLVKQTNRIDDRGTPVWSRAWCCRSTSRCG